MACDRLVGSMLVRFTEQGEVPQVRLQDPRTGTALDSEAWVAVRSYLVEAMQRAGDTDEDGRARGPRRRAPKPERETPCPTARSPRDPTLRRVSSPHRGVVRRRTVYVGELDRIQSYKRRGAALRGQPTEVAFAVARRSEGRDGLAAP